MSEQQMPARIWVNPIAIASPDIYFPNAVMVDGNENIKTGDVSFVRADIAERMAEALVIARKRIAYLGLSAGKSHERSNDIDFLPMIDAALSAFKDSAQDRGAS